MLDSEWQILLQCRRMDHPKLTCARFKSMVPTDQAPVALEMFNKWIKNEAL
jgi:hypothetical protein